MLVIIQMGFFQNTFKKLHLSKTSEMLALRYLVPGIKHIVKGNGCFLSVHAAQKLNKNIRRHYLFWMIEMYSQVMGGVVIGGDRNLKKKMFLIF